MLYESCRARKWKNFNLPLAGPSERRIMGVGART